ncbi:MAG: hypothetical protein HN567_04665 [Actinobacteria bacterium]|jgi:hypothetical protein|nr:hypothetical protein [Actinomycetota bacterium]MBT3746502.1 hypothetical protein [Actinomycetota bacterium]MBT3969620.1 hypothetical protein [Actinomycetota bacterium]MBT4009909.1 hypothetical protein [Actinomycetota bacterium]MBT4302458.1 hypothetical protein [Actinomycetota bacterium]
MDASLIRKGALAGMIGGAMMAMFSMVAMAADGEGFWAPVNLIAHTIWDGAPLNGDFDFGALALGMGVHMMLSMMIGVMALGVAQQFATTSTVALAIGMAVALGAWVGQEVIWPEIDQVAADGYTNWVLLVGHVIFGMVLGAAAATSANNHQPQPVT